MRSTDDMRARALGIGTIALVVALLLPAARAQSWNQQKPVVDEYATMQDKLGQRAALETTFTDSTGRVVELTELCTGERPVILNLGYYSCPGMCGIVLNFFVGGLRESGMIPGRDFDLLTVSIDHREQPDLAREKKATYVEALGRPEAAPAWHFLVGAENQIAELAGSVGWRYRYSEHTGQYDHPPTIVVLSPTGRVARYLDTAALTGSTLRSAVIEAGEGRVGTFLERILVSCLTFDPNTSTYSLTAMTIMRIGGAVTVLALALMIFVLWRRERYKITPSTPERTPEQSGSSG